MEPRSSEIEAADAVADRLVEAMVAAWQDGGRPDAAEYLAGLDDRSAIRLIFEEYCLRREAGIEADPADFEARYPRWWPELEMLLECRRLMEPDPAPGELPAHGEDFLEFRVLAELGRGAQGRVFLASDRALADRPVVLKVTQAGRDEHLALARLQHMAIVPMYSAQVLPDRRLQVLCMPFLGGATLARVLELLADRPPADRTGGQLVDAIDRIQAGLPVTLPCQGPFRRYIAGASYVEAICWVGICLADGLQYAHGRGFVHMDIKPSNVLLAGDGQPMLLDFHLARGPMAEGDPPPRLIGGTPGSMAPEQALALEAARHGRPIPSALDGRADLFSLGRLLREALGGPEARSGPGPAEASLRRLNPRVPPALAAIVARCHRPDPAERYPDAGSLAADLRRFLDGRPLLGVSNGGPVGRWRAWRRRRPHALTRALILLVAAMTAAALALLRAGYLQRLREVDAALAEAQARLDRREPLGAAEALRRGLALAASLPNTGPHRVQLLEGLSRARRQARAEELHRLAELARFRFGIDPPPPDEAQALIRRAEAIWRERAMLAGAEGGRGDLESERTIREDLLDLAFAWAHLIVRIGPASEAEAARRDALRLLDEAKAMLGPGPAIARERRVLTGGAGASAIVAPASAWDHRDLGQSYLRSGEIAEAAEQFRLGLGLRPQDFWMNFHQGLCAYRLGQFEEAAAAFRVCVALSPETAECYHNRALALGALGRTGEAIADYTRALDRNPALVASAINRGMLHYREGRLNETASDLNLALTEADGRVDRATIHYNLALVRLAQGDRAGALANLETAAGLGHEEARSLRDRLATSPRP